MAGSGVFRGFIGFALGESEDPFGLLDPSDLTWSGPVPPMPEIEATAMGMEAGVRIVPGKTGGSHVVARKRDSGSLLAPRGRPHWKDQEAKVREKALLAWEVLLARDAAASDLGTQLADAEDEKDAKDTLRYAFAQKATATISKRLGSVQLYARWSAAAGVGFRLPLSEKEVYSYVRALEVEQAPATRAQSFVEAVRFLFGVAGLHIDLRSVLSARVLGAAMAAADRKRVLVQSPPLSVYAVAKMEEFVLKSSDEGKVVLVGGFVFMIHTRFRYYDTVRIQREPKLDVSGSSGFIETFASSEYVKSGQTKKRRRREIPVVGLAYGVLGAPWASRWLEARASQGLNADVDGTLLPARRAMGWSKASADVAEANAFLRQLLCDLGVQQEIAAGAGTHSCKATLLSWCAKMGVRGEHRRLLGGHAKPKERTMLEYSRDAIAAPLESLASVIGEVRLGRFNPDADRSGRRGDFGNLVDRFAIDAFWNTEEQMGVTLAAADVVEEEVASEDSDSSAASPHCSEEEASDADTWEKDEVCEYVEDEPIVLEDAGRLYRHLRYGTIHKEKEAASSDEPRLACGVLRSRTEVVTRAVFRSSSLMCLRCFGYSKPPDLGRSVA